MWPIRWVEKKNEQRRVEMEGWSSSSPSRTARHSRQCHRYIEWINRTVQFVRVAVIHKDLREFDYTQRTCSADVSVIQIVWFVNAGKAKHILFYLNWKCFQMFKEKNKEYLFSSQWFFCSFSINVQRLWCLIWSNPDQQLWNVTKYIYSSITLLYFCFLLLDTSTPLHSGGKYCTFYSTTIYIRASVTSYFADCCTRDTRAYFEVNVFHQTSNNNKKNSHDNQKNAEYMIW